MIYEFSRFGWTDYYHIKQGEDLTFYAHMHRAFELFLTLDGEITVTIDKKDFVLNKGEAVLIFPNQPHSYSSQKEKHIYWAFSPELVREFSSQTAKMLPDSNKFTPSEDLVKLLLNTKESDSILKKKGALYSLCAEFSESAKFINRGGTSALLIDDILTFVENNYSKDCSLSYAAKQLGYSYSYLSRHFQKSIGIPFNSFVNQFRISKACYLLKNTDISILECAIECGYSSVYSFIRNFKLICKSTPSEYRSSKPVLPLF